MTLSSTASRIDYAGNGSAMMFAFPYYFLADSDLAVVRRDDATGAETTLVLGGDYTVAGAGAPTGGEVTLSGPLAVGETLTIRRQMALVQETDFVANDPLSAEVLERAIDRAVMGLQQLAEVQARTLQFPIGDGTGLSTILPPSNVRASRNFGFNASGEPIAVDPPVVDSSALLIVGGTSPTHQIGRFWVDTGTANTLIVSQSDGTDWTELWRVDTAANAFRHETDLTVASTDAGEGQGPTVTLDRASASPGASDLLGALAFQGRSTSGAGRTYARFMAEVVDPTDSGEDGGILLQTMSNGALATRLALRDRLLLGAAVETAKGADVASAATTDIWSAGDGTLVHITGTTTITSFGTAPQAGALRILLFDAALTLTHGASLVLNAGGGNIVAASGDMAVVLADTTTKIYCYVIRASGGVVASGLVQQVYVESGSVATGTTAIPQDDTIPQITEGDQYMAASITPTSANNRLRIRALLHATHSTTTAVIIAALFQDSTANALQVGTVQNGFAALVNSVLLEFEMVAGSTNSTTFKIRIGGNQAGTLTFNGHSAGRIFGGALKSTLTIEEFAV